MGANKMPSSGLPNSGKTVGDWMALSEYANANRFQRAAFDAGLIILNGYDTETEAEVRRFILNLNQGTIGLLNPSPDRVMQLVQLARTYGGDPSGLLHLRTKRAELSFDRGNHVLWYRAYVVGSAQEGWLTLAVWLREYGLEPGPV